MEQSQDHHPSSYSALSLTGNDNIIVNAKALEAQAAAAVAESETKELPRVDSAHDDETQMAAVQENNKPSPRTPLTVRTSPASAALPHQEVPAAEAEPQSTSPNFDLESSPQKERLPSFRQLTGQLSELAEAAATQDARASYHHRHSQSFGSATSQSPRIPFHTPFPMSSQTSPVSHYGAYSARSPTSTAGEAHPYGSPQQYPTAAYFADRRPSVPTDPHISFPPPLPMNTSSGESHGLSNSSTDGQYSTAQTTPIDPGHGMDGTPRPILPPPPGMPQSAVVLNQGFRCDFPGCNSVPFQTQYLLSSHRNVHSQNRPHYCPVQGCPRSEGGKGFKRKNEMIRHGLVHNSPGYICPFCPDREHKYPRPDNLQRHVRVHHVDKDRDDPLLREVLAQRAEGSGKTRRRRTNMGTGGPPSVDDDDQDGEMA